jgi:hypothetical protein
MKRFILVLVLVAAFVVPSFGDDTLTLATGDPKATYSMMYRNLSSYCSTAKEYTETSGGFDNLQLILTKTVNMGIVPEDVLEMQRRTDGNVLKNVRALVGLHTNPLHIIILKDVGSKGGVGWFSKLTGSDKMVIRDLRDLKGKKVACHGSSIVTAEFLNERCQAGIETIRVNTPAEGLTMLKNGDVVALFATAGWPVAWIDNMDPKLFTLASLDEAYVKKMGEPYKLVKLNYAKLGCMGVVTAGARNVIAVWNYVSPAKIKQVMDFKQCLLDNLADIKEMNGSHPSWNDVDDTEDFQWPKYEGIVAATKKK